jgi:hypothetical protein
MPDVFEEASVDRLVTGGAYVLVFGLITAIFGWLFMAVVSRSDIGVGPKYLGYITTATALHVIALCISGGFHQGLSKYLSEALVESKEKALRYAKAGFLIFVICGFFLFGTLISISIVFIPINPVYGLFFGFLAIIYLLTFFRDNFLGNLAAIHRFDYIGYHTFLSGISGVIVGVLILFLVPFPDNAYLLPMTIIVTFLVAVVLVFYYGKKVVPYPLSSVLGRSSGFRPSGILDFLVLSQF